MQFLSDVVSHSPETFIEFDLFEVAGSLDIDVKHFPHSARSRRHDEDSVR